MKGIRVGLALSGWGLLLGMVAALAMTWFALIEGSWGIALFAVVVGGSVGAVLGGVLGCPVALLSAAFTHRDPKAAARWAVLTYLVTAGAAAALVHIGSGNALEGFAQLAIWPILLTLPIAAARVHRTVRLEIAHDGFWR